MSRRQFLLASAFGGLSLAAYSAYRGIRFPRLSFEPAALANTFTFKQITANTQDLIITPSASQMPRFRAYAPEPKIHLSGPANSQITIAINNIAIDAELQSSNNVVVEEKVSGISRELTLVLPEAGVSELTWQLPVKHSYSFAVIGDSGGDKELAWCLKRAHDLGARFLLHLGDFNYQPGDYERSIMQFDNADLPVYVSIGNHDFHEDGLLHDQFRQNIGPLNHSFTIGQTRFANIDTAASVLPYGAGHRGRLFDHLISDANQVADTVAFTHRPIYDPSDNSDHDLGSTGERDWLVASLKQAQVKTLLSGHIHIYNRGTYHGIENIIVGQGLGHQDLIVNYDYSKMLVGDVDAQGLVSYRAEPLGMPMALHCHPRSDVVKRSLIESEHYPDILEIDRLCEESKG